MTILCTLSYVPFSQYSSHPKVFIFYNLYILWYGPIYLIIWVRLQQPQEQHYPVPQVYAGSFCVSVIHQTLTWTTGSLTCVCDHSYVYWGWAQRQVSTTFFWFAKTYNFLLCSRRGSNLLSLDLESDTLPAELPQCIDQERCLVPSQVINQPHTSTKLTSSGRLIVAFMLLLLWIVWSPSFHFCHTCRQHTHTHKR